MADKKKICGNCKFAGARFKIGKVTHYHCKHPSEHIKFIDGTNHSAWDTVRQFNETCVNHELKPKK